MRIIYLHQYFNTPDMSGGTRSYEMAKRLVQKGHEVHIITTWREPTKKSTWFTECIDGINVHWLPVEYSNTMSFISRIKAFFSFALKCSQKAIAIRGDIVFATSTPLTIAIPAYLTSRRLKIPQVFEVRDLWPELPIAIGAIRNPIVIKLAKMLEIFAYKKSKQVVALSPGMAAGVLPYNANVTTIPNSCDLDLFAADTQKVQDFKSKFPEIGSSPFALYAGTFGLINGVSYLVDVAEQLKTINSNVKIIAIGHGYEWNKVRHLAETKGVLNDNFFIYSSIPKSELVNAFAAATFGFSLFVDLKEMEANSANKFFDTLASGTPILINYGGWQAEIINEWKAGKQISRDPQIAAEYIDEKSKDKIYLGQTSLASRKLAENMFSRDILAEKLEATLIAALNSN